MNLTAVATQTEGYSATDLKDLVDRAIHQVAVRVSNENLAVSLFHSLLCYSDLRSIQPLLSGADLAAAHLDFVPLSLRDVKFQKSEVVWSDIGGMRSPTLPFKTESAKNSTGLHETRRVLRETLEWPTKYGPIFAQSSLRLRSGSVPSSTPCGSPS